MPAPTTTSRRRRPPRGVRAPNRLEPHGGRLELRLARGGIDRPRDHAVQRAGAGREVQRAPVERREGGAGRHVVAHPQLERRPPPARAHHHGIAVARRAARGVVGVELDERLRLGGEQVLGLGRAGHRVPLVGDAPGREHERELVVRRVDGLRVRGRRQARASVGRREAARGVEAVGAGVGLARRAAGGHRPLQRALAPRGRSCERPVWSQSRPSVVATYSSKTAAAEVHANCSRWPSARPARAKISQSGSACAGRVDDPPHERHAALGVRLRALLLRPLRGRAARRARGRSSRSGGRRPGRPRARRGAARRRTVPRRAARRRGWWRRSRRPSPGRPRARRPARWRPGPGSG